MCMCLSFVFFKQKTAYEMRISDWSSDVCSSDLLGAAEHALAEIEQRKTDDHADRGARYADRQTDRHEDAQHRVARRAHRAQYRHVARLGTHQHDKRRHDVEGGDEDDQRQAQEHRDALDRQSLERSEENTYE